MVDKKLFSKFLKKRTSKKDDENIDEADSKVSLSSSPPEKDLEEDNQSESKEENDPKNLEKAKREQLTREAKTLFGLGKLGMTNGKYDRAIKNFMRAQRIYESLERDVEGKNNRVVSKKIADCCYNGGCSYILINEFEKATPLLEKAQEIYHRFFKKSQVGEPWSLPEEKFNRDCCENYYLAEKC